MPVEKLGWFRKRLVGIGKRIYYAKSEKLNFFIVNLMVKHIIKAYAEIFEDYEKALEEVENLVRTEAKNILVEIMERPIFMGKSMKMLLSKSLDDIAFMASTTFFGILGKDYTKFFAEPEFSVYKGVGTLSIRMNRCPICAGVHHVTQKDLGEKTLAGFLAVLFGEIIELTQEYVGNEYIVEAQETKCFMKGDPYGEIVIKLIPKEINNKK
ncbi:MAG: hypothetical protein ACTSR3_06135 [Candidatus Helarchaeota archaeon]